LQGLRDEGKNPYPHKFHRDFTIPQFNEKFNAIKISDGEFLEDNQVSITGRIMMVRPSGANLIFIDLVDDNSKVQIFATASSYKDDFEFLHKTLKRGDIIGVEGFAGRTKTGELSVRPNKIVPLSYCLHMLPRTKEGENVLNKDSMFDLCSLGVQPTRCID